MANVGKSEKSGEQWLVKSGEKLEKVGNSWEKWTKSGYMWFYVAKSGFMWLKVVLCGSKYVLPKILYMNTS